MWHYCLMVAVLLHVYVKRTTTDTADKVIRIDDWSFIKTFCDKTASLL